MKPSSKDRITVSILLVVSLLVILAMGYMVFGKPKVSGMTTTSTKIVKVDNLEQIERYKKYIDTYAIKVQENNKVYLKFYSYENSVSYESKLDLTLDQFNKLVEGKEYWFEIELLKTGDKTNGTIKKIYTEDPVTM